MKPTKYKTIPEVVEAVQFFEAEGHPRVVRVGGSFEWGENQFVGPGGARSLISDTDWIVTSAKYGYGLVVPDDQFRSQYEEVKGDD